ncbi:MAG: FtsQ-type POTRA domain-containing protein [Actinobacteria bacterium]|nr:FtsQ-type POTRA domain-containing protein [Actinomycetota bacterium]
MAGELRTADGRSAGLTFGRRELRPLLAALESPRLARGLAYLAVVLLCALGAYFGARETGMFALRQIEIEGARGANAAKVRAALAPLLGSSLVALEREKVESRLAAVPIVAGATYDRNFPHTLRVRVSIERPVAVLRRGSESWLLSAGGRVLAGLPGRRPPLPRIWVARAGKIYVGGKVSGSAQKAVHALGPLIGEPFLRRVRAATASGPEITLTLRSGLELRLGDLERLPLKLAVARRVITLLGAETSGSFLDVSAPARPFFGRDKSKVEG